MFYPLGRDCTFRSSPGYCGLLGNSPPLEKSGNDFCDSTNGRSLSLTCK